ncbi:hypothetical protein AC625_24540 [Peribacillus loiseleuriae]|uniref:Group II intron maturase-specific domain-containing protein n=1 Tax=Peribacillus loiseleuriae TaxID=1679170 RepID=A0A0K9G7U8_9BACI|nr:hypothetical protein AC625_24540 [Peribacillus loiseleuriae]
MLARYRLLLANMAVAFFKISISCFIRRFSFGISVISCGVSLFSSPFTEVNRLKKFNLEIAEDKTKVIPIGRFAKKDAKQKGNKKPATFDFLGFTHYCGKSKQGNFRVKRKSSRKKVQGKLKESKEWLKNNRNKDIHMIMDRFKRSLIGYYNYYCITDNTQSVNKFKDKIGCILFKWLIRELEYLRRC